MIAIYILFFILIIAILLIAFFILATDKFQAYIIRINEAETNIDSTLNKRYDLLNKANDIIKKELNLEIEPISIITDIRSKKIDNYELDKKLNSAINDFHELSEDNLELKDNNEYTKIEIELIDSEALIISLKKYYNDIVDKYNELIESFPYKFVAKFKKFTSKELFSVEDGMKVVNELKQR